MTSGLIPSAAERQLWMRFGLAGKILQLLIRILIYLTEENTLFLSLK